MIKANVMGLPVDMPCKIVAGQIEPDWDYVTLERAQRVAEAANKLPDKVIELYRLAIESDEEAEQKAAEIKLTNRERTRTLPLCYLDIAAVLFDDLPKTEMLKCKWEEITEFYVQYVLKFVVALMVVPDYEPVGLEKFTHNNKEYWLPESETFLNHTKGMTNTTSLEFTEAADLKAAAAGVEQGQIGLMANIVAILCRPKWAAGEFADAHQVEAVERGIDKLKPDTEILEPYNETRSLQRAEQMGSISMSVIWEVFFCLHQALRNSAEHTLYCSAQELERLQRVRESRSYVNTVGVPSVLSWLNQEPLAVSAK